MEKAELEEKSVDRRLVELLFIYGSLTLPKLSKLLGLSSGAVDYRLKKLEERKIVIIRTKPHGTTYKPYGTTYELAP